MHDALLHSIMMMWWYILWHDTLWWTCILYDLIHSMMIMYEWTINTVVYKQVIYSGIFMFEVNPLWFIWWWWCILEYDEHSLMHTLLYNMMYMHAMVWWCSSMDYDVYLMMMHTRCTLRWLCILDDEDAYPMMMMHILWWRCYLMIHYYDAYLMSVKAEQNYLFSDCVWWLRWSS